MIRPKLPGDRLENDALARTPNAEAPATPGAQIDPQTLLDSDMFEELRTVIGPDNLRSALEEFASILTETFREGQIGARSRDQIFEVAHMLTGRAGFMGFTALHDACLQLQDACKKQRPFDAEYVRARELNLASQPVIASLLKQLS